MSELMRVELQPGVVLVAERAKAVASGVTFELVLGPEQQSKDHARISDSAAVALLMMAQYPK